ncbi:MAG: hypothetical protein GWO24_01570, partial [Akkermansiaceae bacterium]|nr:hypothetical protein [Akkermansiaceae bacterium]
PPSAKGALASPGRGRREMGSFSDPRRFARLASIYQELAGAIADIEQLEERIKVLAAKPEGTPRS